MIRGIYCRWTPEVRRDGLAVAWPFFVALCCLRASNSFDRFGGAPARLSHLAS